MESKAIKLARQDVRQIRVPDLVGILLERDPFRLLFGIGSVKQAKLNFGGVFGIDGEIDTGAVPRGA